MMDANTLIYLLEASVYQLLFLAFYWFILKKDTFFTLNRSFLLAGLIGSVVFPMVPFSLVPTENIDELASLDFVYSMVATPIASFQQPAFANSGVFFPIDFISILSTIYLLGVIILGMRFAHNIFKLLTHSTQYVRTSKSQIIYQTALSDAFSFFSKIYLPHAWVNSKDSALIIAHEEAHVQFWHSIDRLLMDTLAILFWFNPFIHIYRKALIENHEYQADFAVIEQCDKSIYQQLLLAKSTSRSSASLVSAFSSLTKKRIIMMNKNTTSNWGKFKLVLVLPLIIGAMALSSYKPKTLDNMMAGFVGPGEEKTMQLQVLIEPNIPSIFPVQHQTAKVRVSSTFGHRRDPFSKAMRMHQGMDISAPMGTPVIASADGIVEKVGYHPNGYGHFVELSHAEDYQTKYAQLQRMVVKEGQQVKKGEVIGYVGSSGKSTAPHLHYEVRKDGIPVDPIPFVKDYNFDDC